MKRRTKVGLGAAAAACLLVAAFFISGPGRDLRNLWSHGIIQDVVNDPGADRKYAASREANLKALYVALDLYQESEGQYPAANGWMDAIKSRLRTNDMSAEEAAKKLVRPDLSNPAPGQYGYAINDAVAGKFKGDIKDPSAPLIFESKDLSANAHSAAEGQAGHMAVSVDGKVRRL